MILRAIILCISHFSQTYMGSNIRYLVFTFIILFFTYHMSVIDIFIYMSLELGSGLFMRKNFLEFALRNLK